MNVAIFYDEIDVVIDKCFQENITLTLLANLRNNKRVTATFLPFIQTGLQLY